MVNTCSVMKRIIPLPGHMYMYILHCFFNRASAYMLVKNKPCTNKHNTTKILFRKATQLHVMDVHTGMLVVANNDLYIIGCAEVEEYLSQEKGIQEKYLQNFGGKL